VTSQGHLYPRFKRALESGNAMLAWAAALEVGRLGLDDALALCLLQIGVDGGRYDAAAVRWHSRFCAETRGVTTGEAQLLLAALGALPDDRGGSAVAALVGVLDRHGLDGCAAAVDAWAERRGIALDS
jgi:hypothetical protein